MKRIEVRASKPYPVLIGRGLMDEAGVRITEAVGPCRAALIADETVGALYGGRVGDSLSRARFAPVVRWITPGEENKRMETVLEILEWLAEQQIGRNDVVVALGGGVTGDIAGFASAIYRRGCKLVQMPTTLLAMVDSSVGGKTGVNLAAGKNLAGAFHQPRLVLADLNALLTLDESEWINGSAEVLKYGLIRDKALFDKVKGGIRPEDLQDVVARCVEIKADLVERDEFDDGARQLLNFGHTIGHALEKLSGYRMPHGLAVARGMALVARAAWATGRFQEAELAPVYEALRALKLSTDCPYTAREVCAAALSDKKRRGDQITLVLPERIGLCVTAPMPVDGLERFIAMGLGGN